ncbi:unnamed protein product [Zymoseptoria tritici ST99CH_1A5]|uniref:Importin N-terminal domain-containing protein n=1 Tax=Zymoseptoria tritici ST99CH_1A5 TaxID=1276529 RepID=A0A1Y6LQQ3_ZYMTR|nr:unnamed protein product [Zymoseptoria tritici ST99CH_1A5]
MSSSGGQHSAMQAPRSVAEVEQLVKSLYVPSTPAVIAAIDDQLKKLQLSAEGWQIADALLGSEEQSVRFFGALTFQVKLNVEGPSLDAEAAQTVLMRLLSWTAQLDRRGEGQLVRKKLCGALGTYLLQSSTPWQRPLLHLAASFHRGDAVPEDQLSSAHDAISQFLPLMSESQLVTLLWLSSQLATDGTKMDTTTPAHAKLHQQMEQLVDDASKVMQHAVMVPVTQMETSFNLRGQLLSCFLNWINYAQPMWNTKQDALEHLRQLVPALATLLTIPDDNYAEALDVFRDVLEGYTSFFQPQHMELLASIVGQHVGPQMLEQLQAADPEVLPLAQFVIAYGVANVQQVVEQPDNEHGSKMILQLLLAILEGPGFPGDDDEVSILSIEFWNTYIEYVNDAVYSMNQNEAPPAWLERDRETCLTLTVRLWSKLRTPPAEISNNWTQGEDEAFREFRIDAADLMLSLYLRLSSDMLQQFITIALQSLQQQDWQDLEAALYCINTVADNVLENEPGEKLLAQLFSSPLFKVIADFSLPVPSVTRRTAVDLLGSYGAYIERHAEFLPDTLRFLFASLENVGLSLSASKSIALLCSTCRSSLTGDVNDFIEQYKRFATGETSEGYTNEKIIGAIAAIIQAMTPESAKAQSLSALLDIVDGMVENAKQLSNPADAHDLGVSALECLASMGKNLQIPDDVPIDVYDDDEKPVDPNNYWSSSPGQATQSRIITTCYTVLQFLPNSGEAIDAVCQVLKSGFTEHEPGPFVFPPSITVSFLEQCTLSTPNIESILSMACTLITQHSRRDAAPIHADIDRIYRRTVAFVTELSDPTRDPGVAQSSIDVFNRMIPRYSHILLDTSSPTGDLVQPILDFAIKAIDGPDLLPKRSAAELWSRIIRPPSPPEDDTVRTRLAQVITAYGPLLCQALMCQVVGKGQRSELDQLCEPLKALIQTQPRSREWLEQALGSEEVVRLVGGNMSEGDKKRFVLGLMGVRGEVKKTRDIVRQFYASCRGTVVSYGS